MKTKIRRLFFTFTLTLATLTLSAIPAKRGQWQIITLENGKEIRAQLMGDEHLHFWQSEDGHQYTLQDDGTAMPADMEQMRSRAAARRAPAMTSKRLRSPLKVSVGDRTNYSGQKKGIVILMQFKNSTKFNSANNQAKYNDLLNKENYVTGSFKGSVADYFKAQSNGKFELTFDVVGPYEAKNAVSYYGSNDAYGNDARPEELIVEAVKAADSEVDFKDYDWDGDGQVDQVFVVYAGKGEANGGSANTIWPHMWWLSKTGKSLSLDSVKIDSYACSNELSASGALDGIGCFCHEFSHCLGFPDFYDTSYSGWYGTGEYDLMNGGSYNGNSYQPAGYTAYEKWMAGWLEPIVLDQEGLTVESMQPLSDGGEAYVIYNDGNKNEYYMLENRQKTGWDASLPGKGLMITHVDFDSRIWEENTPNTQVTTYEASYWGYKANDHQRYAIICADNSASDYTAANDLYPYGNKNSLTNTSTPAATLYNKNTDGKKLMNKPVTAIKQNGDRTMSFIFRDGTPEVPDTTITEPIDTTIVEPIDTIIVEPIDTIPDVVVKGDTLFYESFNKCASTGGNDGKWNGQIASSAFNPDNADWTYLAGYAANQCARFGNGSKTGIATTPEFDIDGEATLTFKAAAWDHTDDGVELSVTSGNDSITLSASQFTMPKGEWGEFTITLTGTGTTQLTFSPMKRFFLDEVLVVKVKKDDDEPSEDDTLGDLNLDGKVDAADIVTLINIIARKQQKQ